MRIQMLKTAAGPDGSYPAGSRPDVPDDVAKVWVDSGVAAYVGGYETAAAPPMARTAPRDLQGHTVLELREMANDLGVTGYSNMRKNQLIEAIAKRAQSAITDAT